MKSFPRWGDGIIGSASPDTTLTLTLDKEIISRIDVFKRQVKIGERTLKLAGIGGVWTASGYRKRGCASALLRQAYSLAEKWGYDGTILFSLEDLTPFYAELSYQRHLGQASMLQPDGRFVCVPEHVAVMTNGFGYIDESETMDILGLPW